MTIVSVLLFYLGYLSLKILRVTNRSFLYLASVRVHRTRGAMQEFGDLSAIRYSDSYGRKNPEPRGQFPGIFQCKPGFGTKKFVDFVSEVRIKP